jgi:hypothetical protein
MRLLLLFVGIIASAQELKVRSEFQRPAPDGSVIAADQVERPREILSPAAVRNGFSSYFLTAEIPPNTKFRLEIGQNPENAVRAELYEVRFDTEGSLVKAALPVEGETKEKAIQLTYWMDLWTDATAPVRRIKVEPQLFLGERWLIYPMEVRVVQASIPNTADAPDLLCGQKAAISTTTIRALQERNAAQDSALARQLGPAITAQALTKSSIPVITWCQQPAAARTRGEWYLPIRDFLYRSVTSSPATR